MPMNEHGAWVPPTRENTPSHAVAEGADAPVATHDWLQSQQAAWEERTASPVVCATPPARKRDKGPDVWDALEQRILREGDDPPYRYVGERKAGVVTDPLSLPGLEKGMAVGRPQTYDAEPTQLPDATEVRAVIADLVAAAQRDAGQQMTDQMIDAAMYRLLKAGLKWR
jgi:hypothetical protein